MSIKPPKKVSVESERAGQANPHASRATQFGQKTGIAPSGNALLPIQRKNPFEKEKGKKPR